MSLSMPPLNVVKIIDPRLQINARKDYVASKGSLVNSWQQFPATNRNNSSVQVSCNPPSRDIAISRLVFKKFVYSITVNGTNTGADPELLTKRFYASRAFPISQTTTAEQMTINNATVTASPISQYWNALLHYHNSLANRNGQYSLCPSMMDQHQDYAEGVGSVRNPLASYDDSSSGSDEPRGAYSGLEVLTNTPTQATLRLTVVEPVLLSPFVFGCGSNATSGFSGVQNMSYSCTLGNLSRVLSLVQDQGVPGVKNITEVITNIDQASLLFNYLTPDPAMPVPRDIESSYFSIVSYPTRSSQAIAPGGDVSLTMNSVQVSSIPRRVYVYARIDDEQATAFTTDTFLSLKTEANPLTLTWNNNQFFSQASTQDLYNMSVKNGCSMSWNQFSKYTGSVACIDFGACDVGLMSDESAGSLGNYQMGITCQFTNKSEQPITPTLYVVVVYEGVFSIKDGNCSQYLGVLSKQDVLNAKTSDNVTWNQAQDIYGGNFFKKLVSRVNDFAKKNKILSRTLGAFPSPYAQASSAVARSLGYGQSGGMARSGGARRAKPRKKTARKKRGGALTFESGEEKSDGEIIDCLTLSSEDLSDC